MKRKFSDRLEHYLLDVILDRRKGVWASFLRITLHLLSYVFTGIVQLRLWLYRQRIIRYHALGCQVISVGNLTVGGTGKTPVVEVLARSLRDSKRKVAILSRGYKKKKEPFSTRMSKKFRPTSPENQKPRVVSDGEEVLLDSSLSGDEPFMLAKNLPGVAVLVDSDRVKSGRYAIQKLGCDTLILDDGFQYQALKHRLDIVLVDRTNPFGNERTLPRGILREPIRNIKRAGFIFITKSNGDGAVELRKKLRTLNPTAAISECRHSPRHLVQIPGGNREPLDYLRGRRIVALSGIAVPAGFQAELERQGAQVLYHATFLDHHRYQAEEIKSLYQKATELQAEAIITTEKDAVRLPEMEQANLPMYFLRVEIELFSGEEGFNEWIRRICFE